MEYLNIINNKLTKLPESIGNLSGLKYDIDAYHNPLTQLTGANFDKAFLQEAGINAHLENAAIYQRETDL